VQSIWVQLLSGPTAGSVGGKLSLDWGLSPIDRAKSDVVVVTSGLEVRYLPSHKVYSSVERDVHDRGGCPSLLSLGTQKCFKNYNRAFGIAWYCHTGCIFLQIFIIASRGHYTVHTQPHITHGGYKILPKSSICLISIYLLSTA